MGLSAKIIEQLDKGERLDTIKNKYPWSSLSATDRADLFVEAERRLADPKGQNLAIALCMMSREKDLWDTLRAHSLIVRRQEMEPARKQRVLEDMRRYLEQIRNSLSTTPGDASNIRRYQQFEADYYVLKALVLTELSNLDEAISAYQSALANYQKLDLRESASQCRNRIAELEETRRQGKSLVSMEELESQRVQLQAKLNGLEESFKVQQQELATAQANVHQQMETSQKLAQEVDKWHRAVQAGETRARELDQELQGKQAQLREQDVALQFLVALPRMAMAPLWVEVIRLALDQGEMDVWTRLALERLALHLPKDALPLLAEASARWPQPIDIDPTRFQESAAHWLALIAQARACQNSDPLAAARILVEAWDGFFAAMKDCPQHA